MFNLLILVQAAGEGHELPTALFLTPGGWVALSMLAVFGIMLWAKVPAMIGTVLDKKIDCIRSQLEQAAALRREAEELRDEYQTKLQALDSEAVAMHNRAEQDAAAFVAKARDDVKQLIGRRRKAAEDRIVAAERAAIADVRVRAARTAVAAARTLIADRHNIAADKPLVDQAIADIAKP